MGMSVLDLARQREEAFQKITAVGKQAMEEDGADVLVLGCMSMAFLGITDELQHRLGIPVVNPVTAALKTAELLVAINLTHSKRAYPFPPKQEIL
jgi:allantoin racemase